MPERVITTFFYGSYMNRDVLAEVDLVPARLEVATISGFDIHIGPLANLIAAEGRLVWGVVATATHRELERLYGHAEQVLGGRYLPEAVLARTCDGRLEPALCYIAPDLSPGPPSRDYVERILAPARTLGFPAEYLERLESFLLF